MKLQSTILQAVAGLLIGAGIGGVLGFFKFALGEMLYPSSPFIPMGPSGPLGIGIFGGVLMGIVGLVIGLITGALRLRPPQAAVAGILLYVLIRGQVFYSDMRSLITHIWSYLDGARFLGRTLFMELMAVTVLIDFAIIGIVVALFLRRWLGDQPGPS